MTLCISNNVIFSCRCNCLSARSLLHSRRLLATCACVNFVAWWQVTSSLLPECWLAVFHTEGKKGISPRNLVGKQTPTRGASPGNPPSTSLMRQSHRSTGPPPIAVQYWATRGARQLEQRHCTTRVLCNSANSASFVNEGHCAIGVHYSNYPIGALPLSRITRPSYIISIAQHTTQYSVHTHHWTQV